MMSVSTLGASLVAAFVILIARTPSPCVCHCSHSTEFSCAETKNQTTDIKTDSKDLDWNILVTIGVGQ
eukprot:9592901-Karenia_brevis.AAC.1